MGSWDSAVVLWITRRRDILYLIDIILTEITLGNFLFANWNS
jgi:hypothetical protein